MAIPFTKSWSASDDGSILYGADLQNLQSDIDTYTMHLADTQTVTGNKIFSGTNTYSGTNTHSGTIIMSGIITATDKLAQVDHFVTYDEDIVCYEGELVYYH